MNRIIIGAATVLLLVGGAFLVSRTLGQIRLNQASKIVRSSFPPLTTTEPLPTYVPFSTPSTIPNQSPTLLLASPNPSVSTQSATKLPATGL